MITGDVQTHFAYQLSVATPLTLEQVVDKRNRMAAEQRDISSTIWAMDELVGRRVLYYMLRTPSRDGVYKSVHLYSIFDDEIDSLCMHNFIENRTWATINDAIPLFEVRDNE